MSDRERTISDDVCPVCHETIEIYAVGQCNHPTCYRCSVRMRILCDQMYCPICRTDLKQIAFVANRSRFETIELKSLCLYRNAMIFSGSREIENCFLELLEHKCQLCKSVPRFDSFSNLKTHMSCEHNLMSCKLCTDNLKLFSHERKFYTTKGIVQHKKFGDPDDKSYKGHPLCEFCNERYFDNDTLMLHLRKDHFFCHFCECDGKTGEYFCKYENLREHFKEEHYFCEEGECATAQWNNAFNSDLDLKAHMVQEHSQGLDKFQSKRLKTIDINFAQSDHARTQQRNRYRNERMNHAQRNRQDVEAAQALSLTLAEIDKQGQVKVVNHGIADLLRGQSSSATPPPPAAAPAPIRSKPVPAMSDFPDLQGTLQKPTPSHVAESSMTVNHDPKKLKPSRMTNKSLANKIRNSDFSVINGDFPSLPTQPKSQISRVQPNGSWADPLVAANRKDKNERSKNRPDPTGTLIVNESPVKRHEQKEGVWLKKVATKEDITGFRNIGKSSTKVKDTNKPHVRKEKDKVLNSQSIPKVEVLPATTKEDVGGFHNIGKSSTKVDDANKPHASKEKHKVLNSQSISKVEVFPAASKEEPKSIKPLKLPVKQSEQGDTGDPKIGPAQSQGTVTASDNNKVDQNQVVPTAHPSSEFLPTGFPAISAPPGFVQSCSRGPPPGFKPKTQGALPNNLASASKQSSPSPNVQILASDDFPALVHNGPPGFSSKKLRSFHATNKLSSVGVWPLAPEIPMMDSETPEQRLTRLVLVEKDQASLECIKLQLLKLNQGIIEFDDFYDSCVKLFGPSSSTIFNIIFKDIIASIKSPKDKAKILAKHQSNISNSNLQWDNYI